MQVRSFMSGFSPITLSSVTGMGAPTGTHPGARANRIGKLDAAEGTSQDTQPNKSVIKDLLDLSDSALQASASVSKPAEGKASFTKPAGDKSSVSKASGKKASDNKGSGTQAPGDLSEEEQEVVEELSDRDKEVRTHEMAHLTAAGPYATGGPTYSYQVGPDGQKYAVGGEVQIDTSPVEGDPEATAEKARVVRNAALAPAEPSAQDRRVAANATKLEQQAIAEISEQRRREVSGESEEGGANEGQAKDGVNPDLALAKGINEDVQGLDALSNDVTKSTETTSGQQVAVAAGTTSGPAKRSVSAQVSKAAALPGLILDLIA